MLSSFPRVTVIILNWNGYEDTASCLESLQKATYDNYQIMLLDNGSIGDDADKLRSNYGDIVHLVRENENRGFAVGNNICVSYAMESLKQDYFLLLNNDTEVDHDFLSQLIDTVVMNGEIGIAGPKVYYYSLQDRIQAAGVKLNLLSGGIQLIGRGQKDADHHDVVTWVPAIMGCCMLIRREVFEKIGMLDKDYFCYHEEIDFCLRASRAGYKIACVPSAKIWHKTPYREKLWRKMPADGRSGFDQTYYLTRNLFILERKNADRLQFTVFIICFFALRVWFSLAVCLLYYRDIKRMRGLIQGVLDGLTGKVGPRI